MVCIVRTTSSKMCKTIELLCLLLLFLFISDHQTNGLEVRCEENMQKAFDFFAFIKNPNYRPRPNYATDIPFPRNVCFMDVTDIHLKENETLTFSSSSRNNEIMSLTLVARPMGSSRSSPLEFPVEIFNIFPNLEEAELTFTGIELLEEDDFANATNLRRLLFEGNNIRTLGLGTAFTKLKNLTALTLQTSQIREIEDFTFSNLDQLELLNLQRNNLTSLKKNVFSGLTNLRILHLDNNQIATIEDGALHLENLEELYLLGNNLKELSPDILTVTPALRIIDVSNNELVSIGGIFRKNSSLDSIVLSDNQIHSVDWIEFASIPSLRILSLERNSLKMEPLATEAEDDAVYQKNLANAMNKTKLQHLNLGGNNLNRSDILRQLTAFRNLLYLNLDNNPIVTIDDVKTIREHFPRLVHISVQNATLSCEWLEKTVSFIKKSKVELVADYDFSQPDVQLREIDGIICVPRKN